MVKGFLATLPANMRRSFCDLIESGTAELVTGGDGVERLRVRDDDRQCDVYVEATAAGTQVVAQFARPSDPDAAVQTPPEETSE